MPDEVPGTTIDRQCGSSQQAVHFALDPVHADAVAGEIDEQALALGGRVAEREARLPERRGRHG